MCMRSIYVKLRSWPYAKALFTDIMLSLLHGLRVLHPCPCSRGWRSWRPCWTGMSIDAVLQPHAWIEWKHACNPAFQDRTRSFWVPKTKTAAKGTKGRSDRQCDSKLVWWMRNVREGVGETHERTGRCSMQGHGDLVVWRRRQGLAWSRRWLA